jgi:hypothetical protein
VVGESLRGGLLVARNGEFCQPSMPHVTIPQRFRSLVAQIHTEVAGPTVQASPGPRRNGSPQFFASAEEAVSRFRLTGADARPPLPYVVDHVTQTSIHRVPEGHTWTRDPNVRWRTDQRPGFETVSKVTCPLVLVRAQHGLVADNAAEWYAAARGAGFR